MATVLMIDDDPTVIQANRNILEKNRYSVVSAGSAREGRAYLETNRPDLIILDVMMEEFTSGFDLAQDINKKYPGLPVIMLTGVYDYMSNEWKEAFDRDKSWLPVERFLEKPVHPSVILYEVSHLLEEHHHN